jgi:hypothetical protein
LDPKAPDPADVSQPPGRTNFLLILVVILGLCFVSMIAVTLLSSFVLGFAAQRHVAAQRRREMVLAEKAEAEARAQREAAARQKQQAEGTKVPDSEGARLLSEAFSAQTQGGTPPLVGGHVKAVQGNHLAVDQTYTASGENAVQPGAIVIIFRGDGERASFVGKAKITKFSPEEKTLELEVQELRSGYAPEPDDKVASRAPNGE